MTTGTNDLKAKFEQDIKGATPKGTDTLRGNIRKRGSIPKIGPVSSQHPRQSAGQIFPYYSSSICKCTEGQGPDGVEVTDGGTSGTPAALSPGVWVCGLGRESSGAAYGAPASTPGAQMGKTEDSGGCAFELHCGLGGIPSRSLRN